MFDLQSHALTFLRTLSMLRALFLCLALLARASYASEPESVPEVIRASPDDEAAPSAKRILFQFNAPVAALGAQDLSEEAAGYSVRVMPDTPCLLSWLNRSLLACTLSGDSVFKTATKYSVKLYKSTNKNVIPSDAPLYSFAFSVDPPKILNVEQPIWDSPNIPYLPVNFNQAILRKSVESAFVLKSKTGSVLSIQAAPDPEDKAAPLRDASGDEARLRWLVFPSRPLPEGTEYELIVKQGLRSPHGPLTNAKTESLIKLRSLPKARLAGVKCYSNENPPVSVVIVPGKKQEKLCNPLGGLGVIFSSPVEIFRYDPSEWFSPKLPGVPSPRQDDALPLPVIGTPEELGEVVQWITSAPVAGSAYTLRPESGRAVKDKFGRVLDNFPALTVLMDHRKPNIEVPYATAVLEQHGESELPIFINNVKSLSLNYNKVTPDGVSGNLNRKIDASQSPKDVQYAVPLGVREALDHQSGFLYGTLTSDPVVPKMSGPNVVTAQVTPWQLHLKLGHFSGLVWVTDLMTGAPVKGARVRIYKGTLKELAPPTSDATRADVVTDANGLARLPGTEALDPALNGYFSQDEGYSRLILRADGAEDGRPVMALLPVTDAFLIDPYRATGESIYPTDVVKYGHVKAWGMTSRGVHRPGETVRFKIFVRNQNDRTLTKAPSGSYRLRLIDPKGEVIYDRKDVRLDAWGSFFGEFKLPDFAASGAYGFKLTASFQGPQKNLEDRFPGCRADGYGSLNDDELTAAAASLTAGISDAPEDLLRFPLEITVADVVPGAYKVAAHVNGDHFMPGARAEVQSVAEMISGGPFGGASAKITAALESAYFEPRSKELEGFQFDVTSEDERSTEIFNGAGFTEPDGSFRASFLTPASKIPYGRIIFQTSVQDESGRNVTARATANYSAVKRFAGLRPKEWSPRTGTPTSLLFAAADERGVVANDVPVELSVEYLKVKSARVKTAGNAYMTETTETKEVVQVCRSVEKRAVNECIFTPEKAGTYNITSKVADQEGRVHSTSTRIYATGDDSVIWPGGDDYSLEIIPEQSSYHPGDTARFLIKNPYPGAYALVTAERYGIIDAYVTKLEGSSPIVELGIKPDHLPGIYVSVTVFSPRRNEESAVPKAGLPDLAKPTFRTGYITVPIEDPYKRIKVDVTSDKTIYKPGDLVTLNLHATPLNAVNSREPISLTVSVSDESVLALEKNSSDRFDPYKGFYTPEGLDLRNYSLLTRLTGRQQFEKKGANSGGDGGSNVRNDFDSLAYWNPDVRTDASGNARVTFTLPDNLTSWRAIVSAATPGEYFGTGSASLAAVLPTEIRAMLPAKVREGDIFTGAFLTSNRTDHKRSIVTTVSSINGGTEETISRSEKVLEPFSHRAVTFEVGVKNARQLQDGKLNFKAEAHDEEDGDALEAEIPVLPVAEETFASESGEISQASKLITLLAPDAEGDSAYAKVTLAPSVLAQLKGSLRYLKSYPHQCWEQRLSRAYGALTYQSIRNTIDSNDFNWIDASKLIQETLDHAGAFQTSDGGMTYFNSEGASGDPLLSAYTAMLFSAFSQAGYGVPPSVSAKLTNYLKATFNTSAGDREKFTQDEIRVKIAEALSETGNISSEDLERIRSLLPSLSYSAVASFVNATMHVKGAGKAKDYALKLLESRFLDDDAVFRDGRDSSFMRNGKYDQFYDNAGAQCTALSAMVRAFEFNTPNEVGARHFLSATLRSVLNLQQGSAAWSSTINNVMCERAITQYAARFENETKPVYVTPAISGKVLDSVSFENSSDPSVSFSIPVSKTKKKELGFTKKGDRTVYYDAEIRFVPDVNSLMRSIDHGFDIKRIYFIRRDGHWVKATKDTVFSKGENIKVEIRVVSHIPHYYVAIRDQIPGGFEPLISELFGKTESQSSEEADPMIEQDEMSNMFSEEVFSHREFTLGEARFYADSLPAGESRISYNVRAINAGKYLAPPVRVEQMYHQDVFGQCEGSEIYIIEAAK